MAECWSHAVRSIPMPANSCFHNKMHFCDRSTILTWLSAHFPRCALRESNIKILQKKNLSFSHLPLPSKYWVSQKKRKKIFRRRGTRGPPRYHLVAHGGLIKRGPPIIAVLIAWTIYCENVISHRINRIFCNSHLGIHRRLSHEDFEPGRTFASISLGHSKFCHLQRNPA